MDPPSHYIKTVFLRDAIMVSAKTFRRSLSIRFRSRRRGCTAIGFLDHPLKGDCATIRSH